MKNKKVNLFIVGAPKCGTTSLAAYLSEHKDIFISDPKEPHYFASDIENYRSTKSLKEYLNLFNSAKIELVLGEGSVFYLYSKEALKNIHEFNKDAKIIVMLRNPIEMIPSLHAQLIVSADENILDFEEAWNTSGEREKAKKNSKHTRDTQILNYKEIGKYAEQLMNVKKYFSDDQIKIILFEDFKNSTKDIYEDVIKFLEVPQNGRNEFPIINKNNRPKFILLNVFLRRFPKSFVKIYWKIKKIFGLKGQYGVIIKKLIEINLVNSKRKELSPKMKNKIISTYKEDINKLSALIGRDLDSWVN